MGVTGNVKFEQLLSLKVDNGESLYCLVAFIAWCESATDKHIVIRYLVPIYLVCTVQSTEQPYWVLGNLKSKDIRHCL